MKGKKLQARLDKRVAAYEAMKVPSGRERAFQRPGSMSGRK